MTLNANFCYRIREIGKTVKAEGFTRLVNNKAGNAAEKDMSTNSLMTTTEAKKVVANLLRPVCKVLRQDSSFLRAHAPNNDGQLIARLENKVCGTQV